LGLCGVAGTGALEFPGAEKETGKVAGGAADGGRVGDNESTRLPTPEERCDNEPPTSPTGSCCSGADSTNPSCDLVHSSPASGGQARSRTSESRSIRRCSGSSCLLASSDGVLGASSLGTSWAPESAAGEDAALLAVTTAVVGGGLCRRTISPHAKKKSAPRQTPIMISTWSPSETGEACVVVYCVLGLAAREGGGVVVWLVAEVGLGGGPSKHSYFIQKEVSSDVQVPISILASPPLGQVEYP